MPCFGSLLGHCAVDSFAVEVIMVKA
jgi:hypothetical protein